MSFNCFNKEQIILRILPAAILYNSMTAFCDGFLFFQLIVLDQPKGCCWRIFRLSVQCGEGYRFCVQDLEREVRLALASSFSAAYASHDEPSSDTCDSAVGRVATVDSCAAVSI